MYYAIKNNRKTKLSDLDYKDIETLLVGFKKSPIGNWIEILTSELKMRDRIYKLNKITDRLN